MGSCIPELCVLLSSLSRRTATPSMRSSGPQPGLPEVWEVVVRILAKNKIKGLFLEKKIITRNYQEELTRGFYSHLPDVCSFPLWDFNVYSTLSGGEGKLWPFYYAAFSSCRFSVRPSWPRPGQQALRTLRSLPGRPAG